MSAARIFSAKSHARTFIAANIRLSSDVHTAFARPSNLNNSLTTKIDPLEISQPSHSIRETGGLSSMGVGVAHRLSSLRGPHIDEIELHTLDLLTLIWSSFRR